MQDGDIYRWSYKDFDGTGLEYWCKSRIAIVHDGKLLDTYWMRHGGKRYGDYGPCYSEGRVIPADTVDLKLMGNLSNLVEIWPEEAKFYDPTDVVDLRHPNNSHAPVMVRKGAERSREIVINSLEMQIEELDREARFLSGQADDKRAILQRVLSGEVAPDQVSA
jgi:hypothetical protein